MLRPIVLILVTLALGLGVAACGGGDDEAGSPTTEETATEDATTSDEATTSEEGTAAGRAIFVANCGSCHTLADAGASGTIGPDLDLAFSLSVHPDVAEQVRTGGGTMPSFEGKLSDQEIEQVAAYVEEKAGSQ